MFKPANLKLSALSVKILGLSSVSIIALANPSYAFSFSKNLGDVSFSPEAVLLTTAFSDGADDSAGNFNVSGNDPFYVADLEFELGLPDYSLDADGDNFVTAAEGSAIATTITAAAGDVLSFNWNFLTNDSSFAPEGVGDYAFFQIDDTLTKLADTNSALNSSPALFARETGVNSFSHTFLADGEYTIGWGVIDAIDWSNTSAISLMEIRMNDILLDPPRKVLPEPSTILGVLAFAGLGICALKRKVD